MSSRSCPFVSSPSPGRATSALRYQWRLKSMADRALACDIKAVGHPIDTSNLEVYPVTEFFLFK
jgi:hypothetical protein